MIFFFYFHSKVLDSRDSSYCWWEYDTYQNPHDYRIFCSLSLVNKRLNEICNQIDLPKIVYLTLQQSWNEQHQLNRYEVTPNYYFLQLEREEMLSSVFKLLLPPEEPTRSLIFWRNACRESFELFSFDQFFMWMQLFKYLPETEHANLVPPSIVFDIWFLFMKLPAYSIFSNQFCARLITLQDCKSLESIDLSQSYRYEDEQERAIRDYYRSDEYQFRKKTFDHVVRIHGFYDLATWSPDYIDPIIDSCFGGKTLIKMADGSKKEIRFIKIGIFHYL